MLENIDFKNKFNLAVGFHEEASRNRILNMCSSQMIQDLIYFCKRVDEGTIKSMTTYVRYKATIGKALPHLTWEEIKELSE